MQVYIHTLHNAYNLSLSNCICNMHAQHNDHVFVGGWTFLCISTTVREVMTITGNTRVLLLITLPRPCKPLHYHFVCKNVELQSCTLQYNQPLVYIVHDQCRDKRGVKPHPYSCRTCMCRHSCKLSPRRHGHKSNHI